MSGSWLGVHCPHSLVMPNFLAHLLRPHLTITMTIMMKGMMEKARVSGLWKPGNNRFCELSVAESIESKHTIKGLKSSQRMYWDLSSTPCALLDRWPAISASAPIRMLASTSLEPVLRVPRFGFLIRFGKSRPDSFCGENCIPED